MGARICRLLPDVVWLKLLGTCACRGVPRCRWSHCGRKESVLESVGAMNDGAADMGCVPEWGNPVSSCGQEGLLSAAKCEFRSLWCENVRGSPFRQKGSVTSTVVIRPD